MMTYIIAEEFLMIVLPVQTVISKYYSNICSLEKHWLFT